MTSQRDTTSVQPMSVPGATPGATPRATPGATLGSATGGLRRIAPRQQPRRRRGGSVRLLKVALPAVMVLTLCYLGYWWFESLDRRVGPTDIQNVTGAAPKDPNRVTLADAKYEGKDEKGRPFSITADSASHIDGDDRHIEMSKPLADIVMSSGAYVALTANDGVLDRDTDTMVLNGDVTLFHDNGLSFQTDSATIDLKNNNGLSFQTDSATIDLKNKTAEGHDPVEGQNGDGELISEGFRVRDDGDTIEFTGKAYMKIYPKQKDQGG
jgi:lipopolysaccharide export system protein LptC